MLPKSSTDLLVSEASDSTSMALAVDFVNNEPWTIETYAEGLMDELFNDIDNILDGRGKRNHHRDRNESIPVQTMTFQMPDVILPSKLNRPLQSAEPIKNVQTTTLVVNSPTVRAITTTTKQQTSDLSKLIFMGLGLTVASLSMIYLTESGLLTTINAQLTSQRLPNSQIPSPVSVTTDPQLELVNYMLEALAVIEQQETTNDQTITKPGFPTVNLNQTTALALPHTQPTETLPLPPATSRLTPTNVVERIYIPVYQSAAPQYQIPTVPAVPIPPTLPSSSSLVVNHLPINTRQPIQPATRPIAKTTQVNLKPAGVNPQPLKVAPPKLPTIVPPPPVKEPENKPQQVSAPIIYSAQLDGLLELGNKSVALFKVDGISRRINLGENIGATGWTLVEVSNGEAIIRRNGEVRSIYTGQKL
ncbi:hypothetical protein MEO40_06610 [Dolichospermum sp. ST_sed1]|nr:hypothetical protein [Dolichospermum sp. ST_sed1]MDD1427873.1 hypothetical protein [Dolichospermum sp. ST_sed9]MDD1434569.1 hypothetical protein [Dolichospermum sp. ST_sed6]MDD1435563.1 hypothetical protein [Dolichospermum sp. ST_sed10]MDD1443531.1 hypothetical protein [Dolichospermum sp. ST_sed3]MDD1448476.1 hypothetical protein [Dolichospermum sp. ST_sed8]MDD1457830.1 hypothetical protein [Dolichospermum sp. ST_sed7]MDD1460414.1 hypothetical protein [Dolichospermum sp. ST_sed2]MDD14656